MLATKDERLTIPVTSPTPTVVAFAPIESVFIAEPSHILRLPLVVKGLSLSKFNMPLTVKSLLAVMPPVLLIVRLLTAADKIEEGSVMAVALVKDRVAPASLALINPLVLVGELPDIVKVFAPTVSVPLVNAKVPTILKSPYKLTPLARFIVKLLSKKAGIFMIVPVPPIIIFVELPPVTVPVIAVTTPLNVKVFGPMAKLPLISAMPLFIVKSPFNVSPFTLFIVIESIVLLTNEPDGIL